MKKTCSILFLLAVSSMSTIACAQGKTSKELGDKAADWTHGTERPQGN